MDLFLIDAIGPFFRGYEKRRINWSKIPFTHLCTGEDRAAQWETIREDLARFATEVVRLGYNAVTLDDLAHLAPHPLHEPKIRDRITVFREEFARLFDLLKNECGLKIFLTSDVIPSTPALDAAFGGNAVTWEDYYRDLVRGILDDFPQLDGLILRIGESDGNDVRDPIRTRLHLRGAAETNRFLKNLLPEFEARGRTLILRTWTVGAHKIGDLIWHRRTLAETFEGIDSPHFIVSMKHGESDFFRYLPLNRAFFRLPQRKLLELQARREYEGAGEYPSYIGRDCERFARELATAENMAGISVWCQTGGWHRFRRLPFLENAGDDTWIRLNATAAIDIFRHGKSVEESVGNPAVMEFLTLADTVIHELLYIEDFARQKLFFRRVRIPPLLHAYWDSLFINHAVRKVLRHFVKDPERALRSAEGAFSLFPKMISLAREADLPVEDVEHMRDLFGILLLARRYYLLPYDGELCTELRAAKKAYKQRWPKGSRERYRLKISFEPVKVTGRTLGLAASLLLRRKRGYRLIDHIFTLNLLGFAFRVFKPRDKRKMPKFLRKSAMGVDALFK
ncbi:MAG: hypothetical protein KF712_13095 [Akkermansiaceae bacterium]|nr:hypothetical protein [Akkermansiaceae bacterium]